MSMFTINQSEMKQRPVVTGTSKAYSTKRKSVSEFMQEWIKEAGVPVISSGREDMDKKTESKEHHHQPKTLHELIFELETVALKLIHDYLENCEDNSNYYYGHEVSRRVKNLIDDLAYGAELHEKVHGERKKKKHRKDKGVANLKTEDVFTTMKEVVHKSKPFFD